jgi:hypothetical protein
MFARDKGTGREHGDQFEIFRILADVRRLFFHVALARGSDWLTMLRWEPCLSHRMTKDTMHSSCCRSRSTCTQLTWCSLTSQAVVMVDTTHVRQMFITLTFLLTYLLTHLLTHWLTYCDRQQALDVFSIWVRWEIQSAQLSGSGRCTKQERMLPKLTVKNPDVRCRVTGSTGCCLQALRVSKEIRGLEIFLATWCTPPTNNSSILSSVDVPSVSLTAVDIPRRVSECFHGYYYSALLLSVTILSVTAQCNYTQCYCLVLPLSLNVRLIHTYSTLYSSSSSGHSVSTNSVHATHGT